MVVSFNLSVKSCRISNYPITDKLNWVSLTISAVSDKSVVFGLLTDENMSIEQLYWDMKLILRQIN